MTKTEIFDTYHSIGFRVIPLRAGEKRPFFRNWNLSYNSTHSRAFFSSGDYNFGLLLGDVIDVEADTPEANSRLEELIGDYRHPVYKSKKSRHHLFRTPDRLLTRKVIDGIEFRGRLHQSVLPPSKVGGLVYRWEQMVHPIPHMPDELLQFYQRKTEKPDNSWSKQVCSKCRKKFVIRKAVFETESVNFHLIRTGWACRDCR